MAVGADPVVPEGDDPVEVEVELDVAVGDPLLPIRPLTPPARSTSDEDEAMDVDDDLVAWIQVCRLLYTQYG